MRLSDEDAAALTAKIDAIVRELHALRPRPVPTLPPRAEWGLMRVVVLAVFVVVVVVRLWHPAPDDYNGHPIRYGHLVPRAPVPPQLSGLTVRPIAWECLPAPYVHTLLESKGRR